ncbi:hypothetical protein SETIT_5G150900v2 [Setaria italica]|uniref:Uncharacterized protein n=1 Tax=Setaria italica TaxID=4555 RepID=A0A368R4X0_SETIT|nr:hypothetical protein SETIT_5G150900v2 [Setaria italica]
MMAKGFVVSKGLHATQTVRFRASLVAAAATDVQSLPEVPLLEKECKPNYVRIMLGTIVQFSSVASGSQSHLQVCAGRSILKRVLLGGRLREERGRGGEKRGEDDTWVHLRWVK